MNQENFLYVSSYKKIKIIASIFFIAAFVGMPMQNIHARPASAGTDAQTAQASELPNIGFSIPAGWGDSVIISPVKGATSTGSLSAGEQDYLGWSLSNNSSGFTSSFSTCLYLDGQQINCWTTNGLGAGGTFSVQDWLLPVIDQSGSHHVEIVADVNDQIKESNESDNRWVYDFTWLPSNAVESLSVPELPAGDTRVAPAIELSALGASSSSAPGYLDTSAYMIGSVAVGVVFPESSGSDENWTDTEIAQVKSEIQAGLTRWTGWSNNKVTFTYEWKERVSTSYEPISMSSSQESLWVSQTMTNIGFPARSNCIYGANNYLCQATDYANDLRTRKGTNWAYVIFVADSSADGDGRFSDGMFAYSYLGGPFMIMTYDNSNWGIDRMEWVTAHETSHTFLAADQYSGGCDSTTKLYGYLGIANSYCQVSNPPGAPSPRLMKDGWGDPDITTKQQVGQKDSDNDGLFDPVDTQTTLVLTPFSPNPTDQNTLSYSGKVYDKPWPFATNTCCNVTRDITINKITALQYNSDGGAWQNINPGDGSLDSDYETFSFTTPTLTAAAHTVIVSAKNSVNSVATWADTVTISDSKATNDETSTAKVASLPYIDTIETINTTKSSSDQNVTACNLLPGKRTVWYTYKSSDARTIYIDTFGSNYDTFLAVWTGSPNSLSPVVCNDDDSRGGVQSALRLNVQSNVTYYIEVGEYDGYIVTPSSVTGTVKSEISNLASSYLNFHITSFYDVPGKYWAWKFIEGIAKAGVTTGCGGGDYCPQTLVGRDQMAVFLLRAKYGSSYVPEKATGVFADVPVTFWAADWIEQFAKEGITSGCGNNNYCPKNTVTRDQMAIFLLRAEHGSTYVPPKATGVFSDVPVTYWAADWIEQLVREGITSGCGNNNFCPNKAVSRDQMAVFLSRTFGLTPIP